MLFALPFLKFFISGSYIFKCPEGPHLVDERSYEWGAFGRFGDIFLMYTKLLIIIQILCQVAI